ncbi:MAG: trans-splicing intein-formed DNA polymerase III subunit alpha C-terminal partner DnaE-C [Geminocystis sp.]|nr:trans-splicing intein-formed DNA polymerase III subunit alpha C-terminal partner DnaE-C [Geminocystis sp.]MCX8077477.1 trans-splicing intein-formed DNA polymerase III subunit alpha C-terminal partner DnaE-C [Geminocystis sp.]MDW8115450.1 trans-splicing intein-formed DNA polymerase III subunit alpha C-terminal partner DnaE-C [Geminocystis sp.]
MVRIVKRRHLGPQKVYDIGVEKEHNFLLANGLVVSNCFNKSHSTAYAYITYQTAYLKANYPVEYMSVLLTSNSDNHEKVKQYRENCLEMGIEVCPPDINTSQKEFIPQGRKILFGLSAIKNLGEAAIENIMDAREKAGGKFKSFADFISRVNLRICNRKVLETLIYAGVFDSLHPNRCQLIENLELMINWAQKKQEEKQTGQLNIFDYVSQEFPDCEEAPAMSEVPDFSPLEKIRLEKEYLGFPVSEHPLKLYKEKVRLLSPINLKDLPEQKGRKKICVLAMITKIKHHLDKNNNKMAFITIEDPSQQVDGVVFARVYERVKNSILADTPLLIWGKIDIKNEQPQIIVDYLSKVEEMKLVFINLNPPQVTNESVAILKDILKGESKDKNKKNIPTFVRLQSEEENIIIRLGEEYWVENADETVSTLENAGFAAHLHYLV